MDAKRSALDETHSVAPTGHYHAICATAGDYTSGEKSDLPHYCLTPLLAKRSALNPLLFSFFFFVYSA